MVARKNSKYLSRIIMIFFFALFLFPGCILTNEEITQRNEYLERAQKYYRGKKYMNALQQIEKALEIDPNSKRGLVSKGWTLFYLGEIDEAEKAFMAAYDIDNADTWCHQGLAALYFKRANKVGAKLEKTIKTSKQERILRI